MDPLSFLKKCSPWVRHSSSDPSTATTSDAGCRPSSSGKHKSRAQLTPSPGPRIFVGDIVKQQQTAGTITSTTIAAEEGGQEEEGITKRLRERTETHWTDVKNPRDSFPFPSTAELQRLHSFRMAPPQTKAEIQRQRAKLVNSYQELLTEFSSTDLRSVGNYNVGRLIGKGSFGKVYLATHKLTNGSKVVLKSAMKDDANLAREIHHHRQLVHPHITRLYEVIVTETLVWLVLEYCPGWYFRPRFRHG